MKNYFLIAALAFIGTTLVSCGDKKTDHPNTFEGVYYDERTSDREYIEKVATAVMDFIKPGEQRDAIVALNAFATLCETYDLPNNFISRHELSESSRALAQALEDDDYLSLSRAAETFVYNLERLKGMYQANPDSYVWTRIEDRQDVLFRYWIGNVEYNIMVSGSGNAWSASVTDSGDSYRVEVPAMVDFTLMRGSISSPTTLITAKIQAELRDGSSINANNDIRAGSMEVVSVTKGTSTRLTEDLTLYRHDPGTMVRTLLMSSTSSINGTNLCSVQAWKDAAERDAVDAMLSSATSTVMVYGSIQIKTNVNNVKAIAENAFESWNTDESTDPRQMAQNAARALASSITAEVRYCGDNSDKLRATLGWEAYQDDDWAEYEQWGVRPTITFTKDGATYDFGSYFGNSHFLSVENSIKSIIKTYKSYWK